MITNNVFPLFPYIKIPQFIPANDTGLDFDFSIYDKLAARFGQQQPKYGVKFNPEIIRSKGEFKLDTYVNGCSLDVQYSPIRAKLIKQGKWNKPMPFPIDIAKLDSVIKNHSGETIVLGHQSDSFMWTDCKFGVTKAALQILNNNKQPYIVRTRSDLVAHDDYLQYLNKDLCTIEILYLDAEEPVVRELEPGAPSLKRRRVAFWRLKGLGFKVSMKEVKLPKRFQNKLSKALA